MENVIHNSRWIMTPEVKEDCKMRLFCLPFAGGGALAYRSWCRYMPPEIELCAVQLPGRENRIKDEKFYDINLLIDELVLQILPYLDKPFALYGHSMGGLISFELARRIRKVKGLTPKILFFSGSKAPQLYDHTKDISHLPDELFLKAIKSFNGMPDMFWQDRELIEFKLPTLRADFSVLEGYNYYNEEPLECPISALCGENDKIISKKDMEALALQTKNQFKLRMFDGDHFFINTCRSKVLKSIIEDLNEYLN
ncbi:MULTISPECIES: thioesterase II family protein [Clostridium]|uniref:Thioesterase II of alpha/beta hydrolase superfamily n=1 Tax=Clostridium acetobutylicum (strain ATCC 824 / DSM 792 / JCM 1419 / IAM 19013 / LMG 5710 / NBRC 13948 / NRRL B-527 / VKM B-1787 / 2291 / W) TaxID=272562 RepID=Q97K97_CLOAB|nr:MULTISPECIES: thioesterase II family protein [Clostridium]AAK78998.1 Thioesterase II of alpha/beta hydrolase superfamily [Clostridium acetobutylicum ATCC 824]ADZ20073.1 Thioesterase II of alpha/beta hydrolase superfamily [Clostridium acetobutylicum EA 2018]AEI31562.1 thioesterase II [Clostridium acetobutylicum DSM 1731]AWV82261.1 thioesterase [Clostridium acetobutylicum]KHD35674.1 thioesterase [Clostridium acetobutylicum]